MQMVKNVDTGNRQNLSVLLNKIYQEIDKKNIRQAVIAYCSIPRSRAELTAFTGKSRYFTMSGIIQPLMDQGIIRMTIPDKPKSMNQRFVTAEEDE